MGIVEALWMLVQGFKLIGDGTAALIGAILASLGFSVPDLAIRVAMLLTTGIAVWMFAGVLPKLVIAALTIFFVSTALGLPTSSLPK
jgi:hypothetical protein